MPTTNNARYLYVTLLSRNGKNFTRWFTCFAISDLSTDSGEVGEEGVYIRFLNQHYVLVTCFLSMCKFEEPDALHSKQAITCTLEKSSIDWRISLVNFTADGASTNFGCRAGVFKLLQKDLNHLIGIHCTGHRLKVALKDAAKQICYINTLGKLLSPFIILSQVFKYVEWLTISRKSFRWRYIETT